MKVCHVMHSMEVGGAEMMVSNLALEFRENHAIDSTVACLDSVGRLGEMLRGAGFAVDRASRRPGIDWSVVRWLREWFRRTRPDVVHAHQYTPYFYGGLAASRERIPLVFTEHGRHQPDRLRWRRILFNKWMVPRTAAVTAVSQSIRGALIANEKIPGHRIEVVYNGIDTQQFRPDERRRKIAREALGLREHEVALGTSGRLVEVKNHDLLLRAVSGLAKGGTSVRVFLAGDGPLRERLERRAGDLGLANVTFLGERDDMADLLNAWDVFVLSSFSEGTSITLLEAMSTARPVVATAVGGNPEIVSDGVHGRLTASDDEHALAAAIAELVEHPDRRLAQGAAARERVCDRFEFGRTVSRFAELYVEVTGS